MDEIENLNNVEKLILWQNRGYLFHGTPKTVTTLSPKPAKDTDKQSRFNNDTAVFATPHPAGAVLFGCIANATKINKLNGNWSVGGVEGEDGNTCIKARIPVSWKDLIQESKGVVCVLPPDPFTDNSKGWQRKSYAEELTPVDQIDVEFNDFTLLGGIIEWIE